MEKSLSLTSLLLNFLTLSELYFKSWLRRDNLLDKSAISTLSPSSLANLSAGIRSVSFENIKILSAIFFKGYPLNVKTHEHIHLLLF